MKVEKVMDVDSYLKEKREVIDLYLKSYFQNMSSPSVLHEAMKYSLFASGKRIRPILALASYEACGGNSTGILAQASALELIHTYSLIHDDLPAMDNDDLRRGKPTNHKIFGEAMAILAGDALLTEAFSMLSSIEVQSSRFRVQSSEDLEQSVNPLIKDFELGTPNPQLLLRVIREVAVAAGAHGMVGGQAQDILSENSEPDEETLNFIHIHKTAALITACVRMGPILADADENELVALTSYGRNIGLSFQIIDDVLDVEGSTEELGKPAGSDKEKKKMTFPALYGIEESRKKARDLVSAALEALNIFSSGADPLREIARYLINRRF